MLVYLPQAATQQSSLPLPLEHDLLQLSASLIGNGKVISFVQKYGTPFHLVVYHAPYSSTFVDGHRLGLVG